MTDFSISAESSLATELFGALDYPWRMRISPSKAISGDDDEQVDAEMQGNAGDDIELAGESDDLLKDLVEAYLQNRGQADRDEVETALAEIVEPYLLNGIAEDDAPGIVLRMESDAAFQQKLEGFLGISLKFSLEWVEGELSARPNANLGNPIAIGNMRVAARAKGKGCIRVFGKKFCVSITSPWIRMEGRRAEVFLEPKGLQLRARAKAHDIDIVIKIRILRWSWKIKIGVTGYVNKALAGQSPVLLDLGAVRINVPGLGLTYAPSALAAPASSSTTTVAVDGGFT